MHLQKGTSLLQGKYIIDSVLGQGGFGITYLATQTSLNRQVAIKEFFIKDYCGRESDTTLMTVGSGFSSELVEQYKRKFIKEAQTIAGLDNPHIIRIHDVFEENGTAYYVMEYLQFGNLQQRIPDKGMNHKDANKYILQIAEALNYVHNHGILHLDVKPSNVMFRSIDQAVLIDFGNAKHFNKERDGYTSTIRPGISEGYAPLEQYEMDGNNKFTSATDVYALGATFYHLLTGQRPPGASSVINGVPPFDKTVPNHIQRTVQSAMKPAKENRLRSIEEFLRMLNNDTNQVHNSDQTSKKGNKWSITIMSILVVVILLGAAKIYLPEKIWQSIDITNIFTEKKMSQMTGKEIVALAEKGDADAQFMLGLLNQLGEKGFPVDSLKAFEWYSKAAEQGNKDAQLTLGECYKYGIGTNKDDKKSFEFYMKAAEQGLAEAQGRVSQCYRNGIGVEPNIYKAFEWDSKAAEQGVDLSQFNMGIYYAMGEGVGKDMTKAVEWYSKAAEQGLAEAQYRLAWLYAEGDGVEKNKEKAVELFRLAAEQGLAEAQFNYGYYLIKGNPDFDIDQVLYWMKKAAEQGLAEAQYHLANLLNGQAIARMMKDNKLDSHDENEQLKEVIQWYTKAAEQGHTESQKELAECYEKGWGVSKDDSKALKWYIKAAGDLNPELQCRVGYMYAEGVGTPIDYAKAVIWWRKAAILNNVDAQYCLGWAYQHGKGIEQNYKLAADNYLKAAEQNVKEAQYELACLYEQGLGVNMNILEAMKWYEKAAEQGNASSQYNLGLLYDKGEYVAQDYMKAVELYRKAAAQGHERAQYALGRCYYLGFGVTQNIQTAAEWWKKSAAQDYEKAKEALEKTGLN